MDKTNQKVVPTSELLKEMEELEILGGNGSDGVTVYGFSNCKSTHSGCKPTYSGNCVAGCACPNKGGEVVDEEEPKPSTTDRP